MRTWITAAFVAGLIVTPLLADDAHFKKTKIVVVSNNGEDTDERDCNLVFQDDRTIVVRHRTASDEVYATIPFTAIRSMTYERAKSPRVKTAIFLSPLALFSPGKKHWLTIEYTTPDGGNSYVLLRLDKNEQQRIQAEAQARTGMDVERLVES